MAKNVYGFWEWVETRMDQLGIVSYRELESRSGFTNGAIGRRKNALKFPTVEMAEGMCRALRVSWMELWKEAGFAPKRADTDHYFETLENLWDIAPDWKKRDLVVGLRAFLEDRDMYGSEREMEPAETERNKRI